MLPIGNDPTTPTDNNATPDEPFHLDGDTESEKARQEELRAYHRAYYQANKERIKAKVRAWAEANPERVKARQAGYYQANKEHVKARTKAWAEANPERKKETDRAYYEANKEEMGRKNRENYRAKKDYYQEYERRRSKDKVAYNRERSYGISPEEFARLETVQDHRCAICRTPFLPGKRQGAHLDHCHASGRIRGLLCDGCNKGIGAADDDTEILGTIIQYLTVKTHAIAWPKSSKKFRIHYVKSLVGPGRASHRVAERAKKYGISVELLMAMFELQGKGCATCKAAIDPKSANVDHCHKCGQVRGLLCLKCNVCVGMFQDDPKIIRRAIDYLKEYQHDNAC